MHPTKWIRTIGWIWIGSCCVVGADALDQALKVVSSVQLEGAGNFEAASAWRTLARGEAKHLIAVLSAISEDKPVAANWLRSAAQAIRERQPEVPLEDLGLFLANKDHAPQARALAFSWMEERDPGLATAMLPVLLNDPSNDLRRRAVAAQLLKAEEYRKEGNRSQALILFRQVLPFTREIDQIQLIAGRIQDLGGEVDLPSVFGFITDWMLIGPFDNTANSGFDRVYPPEGSVDFSQVFEGKNGPVKWASFHSEDPHGMVDFNRPFGALKGVAGYACSEFVSDRAQEVELRLGCKNGWKIWLNGKYLFGRDEYHRGMQLDQYKLKAVLKEGSNLILVKLCQNEQVEEWTVEWEFQLRVCDQTGAAILPVSAP